jgi:hypothetical protein
MVRKSFFKERTKAEIKASVNAEVDLAYGLVQRIETLEGPESLIVNCSLIPNLFLRNASDVASAARKYYKHGTYLSLPQPRTRQAAYTCKNIPLELRNIAFDKLSQIPEENNFFLGYVFSPVQGNDLRKRVVPFVWLLEGARLYSYAQNFSGGITVKPYADAGRVKVEGADIVCDVPSREKKMSRYDVRLKHVPVEGSTERRAVTWSLCSDFGGNVPAHKLYNIRYTWPDERKTSDVFTFYPQDIAAYLAVIEYYLPANLTPLEMTPLALPSRMAADFYVKLCNNVLIRDQTLCSEDKLRKPGFVEKSILISRLIGQKKSYEVMYADGARDGKLRDYNWQIK